MRVKMSGVAFVAAAVLLFRGTITAETIVVDLAGGGDFVEIQRAIDEANDGDTLLVKPGEYTISEPVIFRGKEIALKAEAGPDTTVLRMSDTPVNPRRASVVVFENGESETTVLEGFTITGGKGSQVCGNSCYMVGGGVFCLWGASPTLTDCVIIGNYAPDAGGGVYCYGDCSPTLRDCTISLNASAGDGGGLFCASNCAPVLIDCTIEQNAATGGMGGGMRCASNSAPFFSGCLFLNNSVRGGQWGGQGGALKIDLSTARLENCWIMGNWCEALGAGVFLWKSTGILTNCIVSGNQAGQQGAVYCHEDAVAVVMNSTISGNRGQSAGGVAAGFAGTATLTNSIVWGNAPESLAGEVSFCLTDQDPEFVDEGEFDFTQFALHDIQGRSYELPSFMIESPDYHLQSSSPCIDAGTSDGAPATDMEGVPRPSCADVDIGAYELVSCQQPRVEFVRGDCNDDRFVNISDAVFTLNWLFAGSVAPGCAAAADINGDAAVNIADPTYLLNHLFSGGPPPVAPYPDCGTSDVPGDSAPGCETPPASCR